MTSEATPRGPTGRAAAGSAQTDTPWRNRRPAATDSTSSSDRPYGVRGSGMTSSSGTEANWVRGP